MSRITIFKPVNRHISIIPHKRKKKETNVLLPEDYKEERSLHLTATILEVAPDCSPEFKQLKYDKTRKHDIVVERSMIQEIDVMGKLHYVILENYVLGIIEDV